MGHNPGSESAGIAVDINLNYKIDSRQKNPFKYAFTDSKIPVYLFDKSTEQLSFNNEVVKSNGQLEKLIKDHVGNLIISAKLLPSNSDTIYLDGIREVAYISSSELTSLFQSHRLRF